MQTQVDDGRVLQPKARADARGGEARYVLVVDDNPDTADTTQLLLQIRGHIVVTAYDGGSALDVARTFCPEVVLLDLGLPDLDGYELADRLRQLPNARDPLFVAVTGMSDPADLARAQAHGFAAHLTKPFDLGEVLEIIAAAPHIGEGIDRAPVLP